MSTVQDQATILDQDNISISPVRIMELHSGPLTLVSYLHPSYKDIDKANEEMGMDSKLAMLRYTYSQFFAVSPSSSTPPSSSLVAVSTVLARVVGVQWNSVYDMCATVTENHVVNVYTCKCMYTYILPHTIYHIPYIIHHTPHPSLYL
ncbi:hypothetical protein EON65_16810 [archaeon]|nr:MAG: hypothetical protein EON65_16810 [archaeon]